MLDWMKSYDVFICPVAAKPAQPMAVDPSLSPTGGFGAPGSGRPCTGAFNTTGWPVVVVRCGASADGKLPIGIQIVAPPWREDRCLAVATFLESRSGGWQRPPV